MLPVPVFVFLARTVVAVVAVVVVVVVTMSPMRCLGRSSASVLTTINSLTVVDAVRQQFDRRSIKAT